MSIPEHASSPEGLWPESSRLLVELRAASALFAERFGHAPRWLAVAPGRVNLIGEHTDYNGGFVLPLAIDRHVVIAAAPARAESGRVPTLTVPTLTMYSGALATSVDIPLDRSVRPGEPRWANYPRGVVSAFEQRGVRLPALDAAVVSNVPLGGGLSSSAALEVATATLLEAAAGIVLDPLDKARICREAEHAFAGVPCGLMDQLASTLGDATGALLIDCRSEVVRVVPFAEPGVSVIICNTNVKHALADTAYARRRDECTEAARRLDVASLRDATPASVEAAAARDALSPLLARRARHVVTENLRTLAAAEHLAAREFSEVGALMYESHRSLRDDFEVSAPELDVLVEIALATGEAGGVFGARLTGGGFGGCTVTLARTEVVDAVSETLRREYLRRVGSAPTTFVTRPARGAHLVDPLTLP